MDCLRDLETVVVSRLAISLDFLWPGSRKYLVTDGDGKKLMIVFQDDSFTSLLLPDSFMTVVIMNNDIRQVMQLDRPKEMFKVSKLNVFAPSTRHIGSVRNRSFSLFKRRLRVLDAGQKVLYNIRGPICAGKVEIPYNIYNREGKRLSFPKNMSVIDKSLLLSAIFYLDILYPNDQGGGSI
nr:uncharacterized protein LOC122322291 isoform X2 [Drosophila bipectinata]